MPWATLILDKRTKMIWPHCESGIADSPLGCGLRPAMMKILQGMTGIVMSTPVTRRVELHYVR
jgi:hypothetical protein